ncbi:uncharacterized protein [Gossypium hirsutum]|uniref:Uncharacterized protein n=1 Tax=Gossypium hirsutum TaxID=3635 RepID=A0A1U8NW68_GOSHI|nr:uncharacterized protein LOC107952357 [Gossypium hirsutum]
MQAPGNNTAQPPRVVHQPPRGRGQVRDIGSTHSYIAYTVSENLGILIESTTSEVTVLTPLGQSIRVNKLFRDVPLEVQGAIFLADLMELPFGEFDLTPNSEVVVIVERRNYLSNVISTLRDEKLVRKGREAYLAYTSVSDFRDASVKDIRTAKEFQDIFPKELPELAPNREVEFGIELILGARSAGMEVHVRLRQEAGAREGQEQRLKVEG